MPIQLMVEIAVALTLLGKSSPRVAWGTGPNPKAYADMKNSILDMGSQE